MTSFPEFPANGHAFSAAETGQALAGLIRRDSNGLPVAGMLGVGPQVSAAGASWKVQVTPFMFVRVRGEDIGLSGESSTVQVDIVPAAGDVPAGQSRIDRVVWDAETPELVVLKGTPAVSPVAPAVGGFAKVGTVRVAAGDGMVVDAQVAADYASTDLAGMTAPWKLATTSGTPTDRISLRNSWQNNDNVNWDGLFTRSASGVIDVNGAVTKAGAYASLEVIGMFPVGMRPEVPSMLPAAYGAQGGYVLVRTSGEMVTVQAGAGGQIAIGGSIAPGL